MSNEILVLRTTSMLIDMAWNKEFNFDTFEFKPLDDRFKRVH